MGCKSCDARLCPGGARVPYQIRQRHQKCMTLEPPLAQWLPFSTRPTSTHTQSRLLYGGDSIVGQQNEKGRIKVEDVVARAIPRYPTHGRVDLALHIQSDSPKDPQPWIRDLLVKFPGTHHVEQSFDCLQPTFRESIPGPRCDHSPCIRNSVYILGATETLKS